MPVEDREALKNNLMELLSKLAQIDEQHGVKSDIKTENFNEKGKLINEDGMEFMDINEPYQETMEKAGRLSEKSCKIPLKQFKLNTSSLDEFDQALLSKLAALEVDEHPPQENKIPQSLISSPIKPSIVSSTAPSPSKKTVSFSSQNTTKTFYKKASIAQQKEIDASWKPYQSDDEEMLDDFDDDEDWVDEQDDFYDEDEEEWVEDYAGFKVDEANIEALSDEEDDEEEDDDDAPKLESPADIYNIMNSVNQKNKPAACSNIVKERIIENQQADESSTDDVDSYFFGREISLEYYKRRNNMIANGHLKCTVNKNEAEEEEIYDDEDHYYSGNRYPVIVANEEQVEQPPIGQDILEYVASQEEAVEPTVIDQAPVSRMKIQPQDRVNIGAAPKLSRFKQMRMGLK